MQVNSCIVPSTVVDDPVRADLSHWSQDPIHYGWEPASEEWQAFSVKWHEIDNSVFHPGVETHTSLCLYFTSFTFHPTALLLSIHSELPISC